MLRGGLDQLASLGRGSGKGFLDQHVDAASEKSSRNRMMKLSRNGDADTIYLTEEITVVGERLRLAFSRDLSGASRVYIHHADQLYAWLDHILLRMKAAQITDAHHAGAQEIAVVLAHASILFHRGARRAPFYYTFTPSRLPLQRTAPSGDTG